jgi:hypothetical protein
MNKSGCYLAGPGPDLGQETAHPILGFQWFPQSIQVNVRLVVHIGP